MRGRLIALCRQQRMLRAIDAGASCDERATGERDAQDWADGGAERERS